LVSNTNVGEGAHRPSEFIGTQDLERCEARRWGSFKAHKNKRYNELAAAWKVGPGQSALAAFLSTGFMDRVFIITIHAVRGPAPHWIRNTATCAEVTACPSQPSVHQREFTTVQMKDV
jgi:hypothetical protein